MTKHTATNTLTFTDKMPVARRKGRKFRRFDPATARMSGWLTDARKAAVARPSSETLARMSKAELQVLAGNAKPAVPFNTKTTKAALIAALTD